MTTLQVGILVVGAILILSTVWRPVYNFIATKLKRTPRAEKQNNLGEIVAEWEKFTNILVRNNMNECAKDMKSVLIKMAQEYKEDSNNKTEVR